MWCKKESRVEPIELAVSLLTGGGETPISVKGSKKESSVDRCVEPIELVVSLLTGEGETPISTKGSKEESSVDRCVDPIELAVSLLTGEGETFFVEYAKTLDWIRFGDILISCTYMVNRNCEQWSDIVMMFHRDKVVLPIWYGWREAMALSRNHRMHAMYGNTKPSSSFRSSTSLRQVPIRQRTTPVRGHVTCGVCQRQWEFSRCDQMKIAQVSAKHCVISHYWIPRPDLIAPWLCEKVNKMDKIGRESYRSSESRVVHDHDRPALQDPEPKIKVCPCNVHVKFASPDQLATHRANCSAEWLNGQLPKWMYVSEYNSQQRALVTVDSLYINDIPVRAEVFAWSPELDAASNDTKRYLDSDDERDDAAAKTGDDFALVDDYARFWASRVNYETGDRLGVHVLDLHEILASTNIPTGATNRILTILSNRYPSCKWPSCWIDMRSVVEETYGSVVREFSNVSAVCQLQLRAPDLESFSDIFTDSPSSARPGRGLSYGADLRSGSHVIQHALLDVSVSPFLQFDELPGLGPHFVTGRMFQMIKNNGPPDAVPLCIGFGDDGTVLSNWTQEACHPIVLYFMNIDYNAFLRPENYRHVGWMPGLADCKRFKKDEAPIQRKLLQACVWRQFIDDFPELCRARKMHELRDAPVVTWPILRIAKTGGLEIQFKKFYIVFCGILNDLPAAFTNSPYRQLQVCLACKAQKINNGFRSADDAVRSPHELPEHVDESDMDRLVKSCGMSKGLLQKADRYKAPFVDIFPFSDLCLTRYPDHLHEWQLGVVKDTVSCLDEVIMGTTNSTSGRAKRMTLRSSQVQAARSVLVDDCLRRLPIITGIHHFATGMRGFYSASSKAQSWSALVRQLWLPVARATCAGVYRMDPNVGRAIRALAFLDGSLLEQTTSDAKARSLQVAIREFVFEFEELSISCGEKTHSITLKKHDCLAHFEAAIIDLGHIRYATCAGMERSHIESCKRVVDRAARRLLGRSHAIAAHADAAKEAERLTKYCRRRTMGLCHVPREVVYDERFDPECKDWFGCVKSVAQNTTDGNDDWKHLQDACKTLAVSYGDMTYTPSGAEFVIEKLYRGMALHRAGSTVADMRASNLVRSDPAIRDGRFNKCRPHPNVQNEMTSTSFSHYSDLLVGFQGSTRPHVLSFARMIGVCQFGLTNEIHTGSDAAKALEQVIGKTYVYVKWFESPDDLGRMPPKIVQDFRKCLAPTQKPAFLQWPPRTAPERVASVNWRPLFQSMQMDWEIPVYRLSEKYELILPSDIMCQIQMCPLGNDGLQLSTAPSIQRWHAWNDQL